MSQAITYSGSSANLAETMNRVCDHHEPVSLPGRNHPLWS